MRSTVAALVLLTLVLGGCSAQPTSAPAVSAASATPTTDPFAGFTVSERSFILAFESAFAVSGSGGRAGIVEIGDYVCADIRAGVQPAETQAALGSALAAPEDAARAYALAQSTLCPTATAPRPAPPATTVPPAGPLTEFATGTFEVGVEVAPGRYRTPGSDSCYWSRIDGNDGQGGGDIIDNYFGPGPQVVTIREGEYFESQRCGVWALQP